MNQLKKQAFTLVELIVVITILTILGTIAFISLQGYSKASRDSVRVADINNVQTSLELFALETGKYPEPQDYKEVTYSGGVVWQEGIYGEETLEKTGIISTDPKDPLEGVHYTYSRLNTAKEYELGVALEKDQAYAPISQAVAGDQLAISYVTGNYNGLVAQVQTGAITYVLAIPTIISTDPEVSDIETLVAEKKLVYTGYQNLPSSYQGTNLNTEGESGLTLTNDLVAYSGSELPGDTSTIADMVEQVQNAYSGTTIEDQPVQAKILSLDTDDVSETNEFGVELMNKSLGGDFELASIPTPDNCIATSGVSHNSHTYDIPEIIHNNQVGVVSEGVSENNGTFTYSLTVSCNDGVQVIESESTASLVSCGTNYVQSGNSCIQAPVDQLVSTGSLISYYPFDGDSLDTTGDHNLNQYGSPIFVNDGMNSQAIRFDGSDDYLRVASQTRYLDLPAATFAFWVRYNDTPSSSYYFAKGRCGNGGRNATFDGSNGLSSAYIIPPYYWRSLSATNPSSFNVGQWYHLAFTAGSNGMRTYVDGTLIGSNGTTNASYEYGVAHFTIGAHAHSPFHGSCPANFFEGDMDEFAIWGRQLSDAEIATLAGQ